MPVYFTLVINTLAGKAGIRPSELSPVKGLHSGKLQLCLQIIEKA
jgi:hypothetical protein